VKSNIFSISENREKLVATMLGTMMPSIVDV
jgi:hypothetical protein